MQISSSNNNLFPQITKCCSNRSVGTGYVYISENRLGLHIICHKLSYVGKFGTFYLFVLSATKILTFNLFVQTTKRYIVDGSIFIWLISKKKVESVSKVFDRIEATFEFDPCTNYFVTPGLLVTGCNPAAIWNAGSLPPILI